MESPITVGTRVRVKEGSRARGVQPGDTGTVVLITRLTPARPALYHVRMDPPRYVGTASFYTAEIEAVG
jgi:hypothetical protein